MHRYLTAVIVGLASLLGAGAFLYPFFVPAVPASGTAAAVPDAGTASAGVMAHAADAPLLFVLLLFLCLAAVFATLAGQQMSSKTVALLGVLTALTATLRALPGPGGFSAVFVLPILAGYSYGPAFGFLLGSLALLVSALIGGGVGPWLPYQMFATGWVGLFSGLLPRLPGAGLAGRPGARRLEAGLLALWGAAVGLLFGAVMNLWFWPFLSGGSAGGTTWHPGLSLWPTLRNYLAFYLATSLWWDLGRAFANGVLLLLFSRPILRVLRRFRRRFSFEVVL